MAGLHGAGLIISSPHKVYTLYPSSTYRLVQQYITSSIHQYPIRFTTTQAYRLGGLVGRLGGGVETGVGGRLGVKRLGRCGD